MNRSDKPRLTATHSTAACYLIACLLVQALIPIGYMPGNVFDGEYMVLCPEGLPQSAVANGHHAHHETDGAGAVTSADKACPIGSALQQAAATAPNLPTISLPNSDHVQSSESFDVSQASVFHSYLSRAPPRIRYPTA